MKPHTGSRVVFIGAGIFIMLYFLAAWFYPGGSQADKNLRVFSWMNNYWCDLLSEQAKNGQVNTARPVAVAGWIILCLSLMIFWYFLPALLPENNVFRKITRWCGVAAMLVAMALFTKLHDVVIHIGGALCFVALCSTFAGFYKARRYNFFYTGLFCMVLMIINYLIMIGGIGTTWLPLIQKITFFLVIAWILFINRALYRTSS